MTSNPSARHKNMTQPVSFYEQTMSNYIMSVPYNLNTPAYRLNIQVMVC